MPYTLGEAAKHTGLSKPTIQRAIKSGKLSASRNEDGSYSIDPAELARAYPEGARSSNEDGYMKRDETAIDTGGLQVDVAVLRERLALLNAERERERDQLNRQIEDLQRRLDAEAEARRVEGEERRKLTAILTDQREKAEASPATEPVTPPPPAAPAPVQGPKGLRGWLHRLTG